jgi:cyanate permease
MGPFLTGLLRDLTGSFAPPLAVLAAASLATAIAGYAMDEPAGMERRESAGTGQR